MAHEEQALPKSDFRQGRRVPRNVYHGDEPLFMAATDELAAELVLILNAGAAALRAPQGDGGEAKEWHPIGTAPRDGTLILIWRETRWSDDAYTVVRWDDDWWQVHDGKIDHPLRGDEPLWWRPLSALDQHSLTKNAGGEP